MKKIVLGISGGISFVVFLILLVTAHCLGGSQPDQTAADRWSSEGGASQVSCFFSVNARITQDSLIEFGHGIDQALTDASVIQDSENPGARLWADAYSADGTVTISSDKTTLAADAIGIGGDYFLFHPVKLLYGSYFSGNDLMQDYCVIDEDAAWQLFGSSNVAGMMVYINKIPHIVTGVVERPSGRLQDAAGLDSTLVYVSYETLSQLGRSNGINHYEIVMPNPVTGFAEKYVRENLGTDEKNTEVVENTSRFSFLSRLKLLLQFGTRSMNGKAIIYPYWENVARGYEDILMVVTLFEMLFLLYPSVLALVFFCIWWRNKGWTIKEKALLLKDKVERRIERRRMKRGVLEKAERKRQARVEKAEQKQLSREEKAQQKQQSERAEGKQLSREEKAQQKRQIREEKAQQKRQIREEKAQQKRQAEKAQQKRQADRAEGRKQEKRNRRGRNKDAGGDGSGESDGLEYLEEFSDDAAYEQGRPGGLKKRRSKRVVSSNL